MPEHQQPLPAEYHAAAALADALAGLQEGPVVYVEQAANRVTFTVNGLPFRAVVMGTP